MLPLNTSLKAALLASALALSSVQAFGLAFTVGGLSANPSYDTYWTLADWSGGGSESFYKKDFDENKESGPYAGVFSTQWGNFKEGGEALLAIITWTPGTDFDLTKIWLKAGTGKSAWFAFDFSGFDAAKYTSIELYAPEKKGISNVGMTGSITSVPDSASTVALLALGLVSLGLVARRRSA